MCKGEFFFDICKFCAFCFFILGPTGPSFCHFLVPILRNTIVSLWIPAPEDSTETQGQTACQKFKLRLYYVDISCRVHQEMTSNSSENSAPWLGIMTGDPRARKRGHVSRWIRRLSTHRDAYRTGAVTRLTMFVSTG